MDDYDFERIDREAEREFGKDEIQPPEFDRFPFAELLDICPEQFELVPIGSYGGENLPPNTTILDDSYIVYIQIPNPEYDCEIVT